ncbi:MAG: hypothetical protein ACOH13_01135 [Flavobacteriales bacterium]
MPRKKKTLILSQPIRQGIKAIKVRLDHRTIITLSDLKKLAFWKERYPQAEVIGRTVEGQGSADRTIC